MSNYTYLPVKNFSMKCRLYPNKTQKKMIDRILHGVQVAHNIALYDMKRYFTNTVEKKNKNGDGVVHFPDFSKMSSANYLNILREAHPDIECVPAGALSSKNGLILKDMKKAWISVGRVPIEFWDMKYYSKFKPRTSYTYQETFSKISPKDDNHKVFYMNLNKLGKVKIRGWNQKIRFDDIFEMDFLKYSESNKKTNITITISKDMCGSYYICFNNLTCYRPIKGYQTEYKEVGLDLGVHDLLIQSDGNKIEHKKFRQNEQVKIGNIQKKMARSFGNANKKFRDLRKKSAYGSVVPSKRYERLKISAARLSRDIARKRENYNHNITTDIVREFSFIGIESLDVKGMLEQKKENGETNRSKHRHNTNLSDAALSQILTMLKYKSEWGQRICIPIGQYVPSSKECYDCGYINRDLRRNQREWVCPICGKIHDRDINAANNILRYAKDAYDAGLLA